ncbi:hypothetical protein RN001_010748 [Aquatica leii]|uniref:Amine oxidase domain-containing protein n=1 Tax=Aquatica leii TaxID=1421715 RepID=A0AAN7PWQ7_9COLE|nr:hypothetical protein RN001_010748 [Aquatica leii]
MNLEQVKTGRNHDSLQKPPEQAGQRIGGRIYSVEFGDAIVDLGAQWSHGEQNNTMYELVKNLDLLRLSNFRKHFHYSNDDFDATIADQLFRLCKRVLNKAPLHEESLGKFVTEKFYEEIAETFGSNETILKYANAVLSSFRHDVLTQRGVFSWYDLSMLNNYDRLKGNVYLNWNGLGHGVVLDVIVKKYPNPENELPIYDKIFFGKEVSEIIWDGDLIVVKCKDKSEYSADYVIVTVSLGVLKSNDITFKPTLPDDKLNAIRDLGIAAVSKVVLHFPSKWWKDDDFQTALLCWDKPDLDKLAEEFTAGPIKDNKSWLENLYEFHVVEKNPNVLIAWFSGEFVPEIERLPEKTLVDGITFILKKFFARKYVVVKPDKILRHNWYSDPHFRGAYSFETLESRKGNEFGAVTLSKPLVSKSGKLAVLFAGEASSRTHYGSVHGAIETGYKEALRIVDLIDPPCMCNTNYSRPLILIC